MSGQLHAPAALPPGTHWIGGLVNTTAGLDNVEYRPVASRNTACWLLDVPHSLTP
jgi:hypothetical protein